MNHPIFKTWHAFVPVVQLIKRSQIMKSSSLLEKLTDLDYADNVVVALMSNLAEHYQNTNNAAAKWARVKRSAQLQ